MKKRDLSYRKKTGCRAVRLELIFSEEICKRLVTEYGFNISADDLANKLNDLAIGNAQGSSTLIEIYPTPKDIKNLHQALVDTSKKLLALIQELEIDLEVLDTYPYQAWLKDQNGIYLTESIEKAKDPFKGQLYLLEHVATQARERLKNTKIGNFSRKKTNVQNSFIRDLATLYKGYTGREPWEDFKLDSQDEKMPKGKFFQLVVDCFEVIKQRPDIFGAVDCKVKLTALGKRIERALRTRKKDHEW